MGKSAAGGAKALVVKLSVGAQRPGGSDAVPHAVPTPGELAEQQGGSGAAAQPAGSAPSDGASTPGASNSQPAPQAQGATFRREAGQPCPPINQYVPQSLGFASLLAQ